MKVLVQQTATGHYLGTDDLWVAPGMPPRLFPSSSDALMHCDARGIYDARIVLRFLDDSSLDLHLPLQPAEAPRPRV
jgi:hypothetical protein